MFAAFVREIPEHGSPQGIFPPRGVGRNLPGGLIMGTSSRNEELINIDDECHSLKGFLENLGIENFVNQYEMIMKI